MAQIKTKFIEDGAITNAKVASGIDAAKLGDGSVSNTEFQRLNGLTGDIQSQLDAKVDDSEKGVAGGVATLDGGGKVPASQLPNSVMEFKGLFDPGTATFTDGTGNAGDVWQASAAGSYDAGSGSITYAIGDWAVHSGSVFQKSLNSNAVASVNGFTGIVVLDSDDVAEGSSNLYFSNERAQDAVGAALTDTASIDLTYNDGANTIEAAVLPAGVDHDALANFVANEHVDHSTINVNTAANSGLSGGGDLTASRSFVVDPNNAPATTVASGDLVLIADISDTNNLKKVTAGSIAALVSGGVPKYANFAALPSGTALDLAFTIDTGDLYRHNGTAWKKWANLTDAGLVFYDDTGMMAVEFHGGTRNIYDEAENVAIAYSAADRKLYDTLGNPIFDFQSRVLADENGNGVLSWSNAGGAIEISSDPGNADLPRNLMFFDTENNEAVNLVCPAVLTESYTIKFPVDSPASGEILQSDGVGQLSWVTPAAAAPTAKKETFTLSAGDITNQYLDLTQVATTDSIHFIVKGGAPTVEGASHDYSVSYTGGVGGKTRITFLNDLATGGGAALVATDVVQVVYTY